MPITAEKHTLEVVKVTKEMKVGGRQEEARRGVCACERVCKRREAEEGRGGLRGRRAM
jgi:hypothetical protein